MVGAKIDYFTGVLVDQHEVVVRMGLFLPAVVLLLLDRGAGALPASLGAGKRQSRAAFLPRGLRRHPADLALLAASPACLRACCTTRKQRMHPVVGLGLTQRTLQRRQRSPRCVF